MSIINNFPVMDNIREPREQQIEILNRIESKLSEGAKKFIICAPTGSGKSAVSKTIGNFFAGKEISTLITSPLNSLVEQYVEYYADENGPSLITLMGRAQYPCKAKMDLHNDVHTNCDEGYCQVNICSLDTLGPKKLIYEERKCKACDKYQCPCFKCEYKKARADFDRSTIGNTNFTLLQMAITNNPGVLIVDESDYVEPFIRMFRTVTIPEYWGFEDFDDHLVCLNEYKEILQYQLNSLELSLETLKRKKWLENQISRIADLLNDFANHQEKWIVKHNKNDSTSYEPITINRFLDDALKTDERIVFLVSATPQIIQGWEYIEVKSPFPAELRPIRNIPIGSMSLKNRQDTIPKLAEYISNLRATSPGKTIVHVSSYAVAYDLGVELNKSFVYPIVQSRGNTVDDTMGGVLRGDVIKKFKLSKDNNQVLIAVNMGRGIDLPETNIINNIITYLKRQNPTDPLFRSKMHYLGASWTYEEIGNELMQSYGRINRNDKKTTNTVITEPEFAKFLRLHPEYLRDWFKEAIV
jgi:hypothetical protein